MRLYPYHITPNLCYWHPQSLLHQSAVLLLLLVFKVREFLFPESLNDLNINAVSLQQGYSKDNAIYIDIHKKYETIPFGLIQQLNQNSKSHLHFSPTKQFAHNNQLQYFCCCQQTSTFVTVIIDFAYHLLD